MMPNSLLSRTSSILGSTYLWAVKSVTYAGWRQWGVQQWGRYRLRTRSQLPPSCDVPEWRPGLCDHTHLNANSQFTLCLREQMWVMKGRTCHSSGGKSYACQCGDQGSILGQIMWDLRWPKWHWAIFSPSTSDFLANTHSTNCSQFILSSGTI